MQLYCTECRAWVKVHARPGEPDTQAGLRTRIEHQPLCMQPVRDAFDAIVAAENWAQVYTRGTTGTTPP